MISRFGALRSSLLCDDDYTVALSTFCPNPSLRRNDLDRLGSARSTRLRRLGLSNRYVEGGQRLVALDQKWVAYNELIRLIRQLNSRDSTYSDLARCLSGERRVHCLYQVMPRCCWRLPLNSGSDLQFGQRFTIRAVCSDLSSIRAKS
jgi:hypothetical protein